MRFVMIIVLVLSLTACSGLVSQSSPQKSVSSSLSSFLYPNKQTSVQPSTQVPNLKLPVRVGLAFLPSQHWRGSAINESMKFQLLNKVKRAFEQHNTIGSISIIPSSYLRNGSGKRGNGFDTLEQIARIHDVDVMALVSYDQLSRTHQNSASLLYWTIVGMYVIPGNENKIQTFVDTAVFDVRSRKLLMRAPGISNVKKHSTAIDVNRVMAQKSQQGFDLAFDDMIKNLDQELVTLKSRIKNERFAQISHRAGYTGGGSFGIWFFLFLMFFGLYKFKTNKQSVI